MKFIVICGNAFRIYGTFESRLAAEQWLRLHDNGWDCEGDCANSHEITILTTPPRLTPRPTDEEA